MSTAQAVAGAMFVASLAACAREPAAAMRAATPRPPVSTAHDFDFERGTWHTHLRRLVHPLAGSTKWVEYDGTSVVRPVWDGRANLVELDVIGPEGHIVGLSVRLFDPQARTWSLNFASAAGGGMAVPAMGGVKNGLGAFYGRGEDVGAELGRPRHARCAYARSRRRLHAAGGSRPHRCRSEADARRHPAELLAFFGVRPGMRVADLGAGFGYTTELLARAVGPTGRVYSQDDPTQFQRYLQKAWTERLARPANANVVHTPLPFDEPLPPEAKDLDFVVNYIFYHDTVWLGADREKMNRAIFSALKPGGLYVVVDASARQASGVSDAQTLHRIEQSVVQGEVTRAGFTLVGSADFLRNTSDTRDWDSSQKPRVGTEDRFVLKFVRPR